MNLIYGIKDKPKGGQVFLFAIQQLLAIMAATIAVPAVINSSCGTALTASAALFGAGVGSIVYLLFTKSSSPVFLGSSFAFIGSMGEGISGMGELITVTLLAGGMLELIRINGGLEYITKKLTGKVNSKIGAELSIAALVSLSNICTANNTIAIITSGKIAKDISEKFKLNSKKVASILDTFSCFIQGIIPYGAQLLMAAGLSELSPIEITKYLYYPILIGIAATISIIFRLPKKYS